MLHKQKKLTAAYLRCISVNNQTNHHNNHHRRISITLSPRPKRQCAPLTTMKNQEEMEKKKKE